MRRISNQHGFSLLEVILVVTILAVLTRITFPLVQGALEKAKANGAGDALAGAIRDARMRAIATGWQYQVVAYTATGTVPNAFRIEGFNTVTGGVAPPAGTATTPPFYGTNQTYEAYTTMAKDFGLATILLPAGGTTFTVAFSSGGQWPVGTPCAPVGCQIQVLTRGGARTATLTVSQAGAVQMVRQ